MLQVIGFFFIGLFIVHSSTREKRLIHNTWHDSFPFLLWPGFFAALAKVFLLSFWSKTMSNRDHENYCFVYAGRFSSGESYFCKLPIKIAQGDLIGNRGLVEGAASKSSLKRLRRYLENCVIDYKIMITLTYPKDFPSAAQSKLHLNNFLQTLMRMTNVSSAVWVMEFQRRGAVHYHILCDAKFISHDRISSMWFSATNGESDVRAGCQTIRLYGDKSGHICYLSKYLSKSYQKAAESVSENDLQRGRYWGIRGVNDTLPMEADSLVTDRVTADLMLLDAEFNHFGIRFEQGVWFRILNTDVYRQMVSALGAFVVEWADKPDEADSKLLLMDSLEDVSGYEIGEI